MELKRIARFEIINAKNGHCKQKFVISWHNGRNLILLINITRWIKKKPTKTLMRHEIHGQRLPACALYSIWTSGKYKTVFMLPNWCEKKAPTRMYDIYLCWGSRIKNRKRKTNKMQIEYTLCGCVKVAFYQTIINGIDFSVGFCACVSNWVKNGTTIWSKLITLNQLSAARWWKIKCNTQQTKRQLKIHSKWQRKKKEFSQNFIPNKERYIVFFLFQSFLNCIRVLYP